jgi:hypothetical protein
MRTQSKELQDLIDSLEGRNKEIEDNIAYTEALKQIGLIQMYA